jgi:hypothetical protein
MKKRFQNLPFNLQRYIEAEDPLLLIKAPDVTANFFKVGLCRLNQVDP